MASERFPRFPRVKATLPRRLGVSIVADILKFGPPDCESGGPVLAVLALEPIGLFQIRAFGVPAMKRWYHFGNATSASLAEMIRVSALISDLDKRAQLLECDIAAGTILRLPSPRSSDGMPDFKGRRSFPVRASAGPKPPSHAR